MSVQSYYTALAYRQSESQLGQSDSILFFVVGFVEWYGVSQTLDLWMKEISTCPSFNYYQNLFWDKIDPETQNPNGIGQFIHPGIFTLTKRPNFLLVPSFVINIIVSDLHETYYL